MPDYFLSDVHLRLDRPDRGRRLAGLVNSLSRDDRLIIVGDLCDFWFASRQDRRQAGQCAGLSALKAFQGQQGEIRILLGNHDAWLAPFYQSFLGIQAEPEPLWITSHGLRVRLEHGHHRKGKRVWKAWLEGRTFLHLFRFLPDRVASGLEHRLDSVNDARKIESDRRMIEAYREYAQGLDDTPDLSVFGHVHHVVDEPLGRTRLIVLGDWLTGSSYLRIDGDGPLLIIDPLQRFEPKPVQHQDCQVRGDRGA